ncbi:MAG: InlB B-repeat-containing protein [Treponema sp.]|nr:InlB B-repeat-containing protein [Treponema sp.]
MKFVKNFISFVSVASLFWMMSCSSSFGDSTDISISFNVNALKNKTAKVMQNAGSISDGEGEFEASDELYNAKLSVTLYEVKNAENIPSDYESFDKSLYKEISFSSCYADESGNMTVTLSAVPIGMKAIIVAEITAENENVQEVMFAGISKVFEVLPEKNIVDLELESCVVDEPVFTLEYKTQTEIVISTQKNIKAGTSIPLPQNINLVELGIKGFGNFLGFYTDSDFTGNPITSVVVDKDITLYAKFEIIGYSITYDIDGATWKNYTPNSSYNVLNAAISYIPEGEDLEKVGYTFEGWYKDADYTEKITSLVGLFEDITLYAKWEAITYYIDYELNGGTWVDGFYYEGLYTIESAVDFRLPSSDKIICQGYVFEGWYDNTGYAIDSLVGRTGNLTLYAKWRDVNQVATVKFSPAAGGVDMGTEITLSCETQGATIHYTLDGTDPTESRSVYTPDKPISIDDILSDEQEEVTIKAYAVCEGMNDSDVSTITYKLNVYTLNFDAKGGTLPSDMPSSVQVTSRSVCDFSNIVPTKTGCIFKGWYLSETPAENEDPIVEYAPNIENTPNKTVTFYAKWEAITYTVKFDSNGGSVLPTVPTQTFTYDVEEELYANQFTRTGYTFKGWNTVQNPTTENPGVSYIDKQSVKNLTISEEITLYAQWQANKATITVTLPTYSDIQGELKEPTKNDDGTKITFTAPESPTGVTYTHNIWYVNGKKKQQNMSSPTTWTFDTTNLPGGIYTIMLVVEDSNGNKYSAEYQVTVTK